MSRSSRFAIQLAVTGAGAVLDYLVGRLTDKLSLGILCWALVTLFAAATIDFVKDLLRDHNVGSGSRSWGLGSNPILMAAGVIRGRIDCFRWTTVINAMAAAALAGIASYAFAAAIITFRFLTVDNGPVLGAYSSYDQSAVAFISSFQASAATAWFIVACFSMALILRPPVVLPLGIAAVSITNASLLTVPPLSPTASAFHNQLAFSLSVPDAWLFHLPAKLVLYGCLIPFAIGVLACGAVSTRMSRS